jgi:hypothetical protein
MAILEVTATEVVQRCAKCDTENRIALAGLEVGVARDAQTDSRTIPLPVCPTCRSQEFLIREPDDEPEHPAQGSFGHLHRMLVDHLHAELVKDDRVLPVLRDERGRADQRIARPISQAKRDRWFQRGMRIDPPAREQPAQPVPVVSAPPEDVQ